MQASHEVWMALDRRAARPRARYPKTRTVRFSGKALTKGVDEHTIEGVQVRIYDPAKTEADCFKYRNKIGLDVALEALGVVGEPSSTRQMLDPVSKRIVRKGRPYRALRPIEPEEAKLFSILLDGTFLLQGFRNRHIRCRLYPGSERNSTTRRKSAGRVTRLFRLLRAHGLIRKVSKTFYYRVTARGNQVMATALSLHQIPALALVL